MFNIWCKTQPLLNFNNFFSNWWKEGGTTMFIMNLLTMSLVLKLLTYYLLTIFIYRQSLQCLYEQKHYGFIKPQKIVSLVFWWYYKQKQLVWQNNHQICDWYVVKTYYFIYLGTYSTNNMNNWIVLIIIINVSYRILYVHCITRRETILLWFYRIYSNKYNLNHVY